jgi:anti-anti-sigma factor
MSAVLSSDRVSIEHGRALVAAPTICDLFSSAAFRRDLADAFARSAAGDVVIMMGGVEACDEDGLGCLVAALRRANSRGATVYLLRVPQVVIDRLSRTGLLAQFALIESLGELAAARLEAARV